ncbi:MAG: hypothetical protein QOI43_3200 [Gaiellales bacterium]|jgi:hypothetical protein|nr:hypothetical protein [Gaiellales bacterium]
MSRASKGTLILAFCLTEKEPPAQTAEIPSYHPELACPERAEWEGPLMLASASEGMRKHRRQSKRFFDSAALRSE